MTEVAILLAASTFLAGLAVAFAIRLLPRLRLQLAGLALLAVVLPLAAVLASGWVMFHMEDDAKILTVAVAAASRPSSPRCSSQAGSSGRSTACGRPRPSSPPAT